MCCHMCRPSCPPPPSSAPAPPVWKRKQFFLCFIPPFQMPLPSQSECVSSHSGSMRLKTDATNLPVWLQSWNSWETRPLTWCADSSCFLQTSQRHECFAVELRVSRRAKNTSGLILQTGLRWTWNLRNALKYSAKKLNSEYEGVALVNQWSV